MTLDVLGTGHLAEVERVPVLGGRYVVLDVKAINRTLPHWWHWMHTSFQGLVIHDA